MGPCQTTFYPFECTHREGYETNILLFISKIVIGFPSSSGLGPNNDCSIQKPEHLAKGAGHVTILSLLLLFLIYSLFNWMEYNLREGASLRSKFISYG